MIFFNIIKRIFFAYNLYKIIQDILKIHPKFFQNIFKFILILLPLEITLLEDFIDLETEAEEAALKKEEKPKSILKRIDDNMPTIFVFFFLSFLFYLFLDAFFFDSDNFPSDFPSNFSTDLNFDSDSDSLPKPPKRKITRSGNPLNLYRYFHYLDVETGERIDDIDRLDPDTYEIVD